MSEKSDQAQAAEGQYLQLREEEITLFRRREVLQEQRERIDQEVSQISARLAIVRSAVEGYNIGRQSKD
jgi:hypothetical protein